jgi:hypothetical protein
MNTLINTVFYDQKRLADNKNYINNFYIKVYKSKGVINSTSDDEISENSLITLDQDGYGYVPYKTTYKTDNNVDYFHIKAKTLLKCAYPNLNIIDVYFPTEVRLSNVFSALTYKKVDKKNYGYSFLSAGPSGRILIKVKNIPENIIYSGKYSKSISFDKNSELVQIAIDFKYLEKIQMERNTWDSEYWYNKWEILYNMIEHEEIQNTKALNAETKALNEETKALNAEIWRKKLYIFRNMIKSEIRQKTDNIWNKNIWNKKWEFINEIIQKQLGYKRGNFV